jgi:hypothetical protein
MKVSLRKTMAKALTGVVLASSLCGLPVKKANAFDLITPSGFVIKIPNKQTQTTSSNNSNLYKQKKQYNWVKPNKYDNWQCAYELTYDSNTKTPDGFKLYVDDNGDNKPDYQYKYNLANVGHYYTGIDFDFKLDYYNTVVGDSSIEDNAVKALNTGGLQAIRQFIYYETDHDNPANYIIDKIDFNNYHYPYVSFYEK